MNSFGRPTSPFSRPGPPALTLWGPPVNWKGDPGMWRPLCLTETEWMPMSRGTNLMEELQSPKSMISQFSTTPSGDVTDAVMSATVVPGILSESSHCDPTFVMSAASLLLVMHSDFMLPSPLTLTVNGLPGTCWSANLTLMM